MSTLHPCDLIKSLFPLIFLGLASTVVIVVSIFSKLDLPLRLVPREEDSGLFSRFLRLDWGRVCVEAVLTSLEYSRPPSDSVGKKCIKIPFGNNYISSCEYYRPGHPNWDFHSTYAFIKFLPNPRTCDMQSSRHPSGRFWLRGCIEFGVAL